ncbi:MAG: hypothetical protein METHAR1v1_1320004 [Methanothrix sp.]|jgi:hypothetical protein|nr:MAG: hypothetical protein METHAR1v1_1320004 [Methanothrix sp.]
MYLSIREKALPPPRAEVETGGTTAAKPLKQERIHPTMVMVVICDDSEIEVPDCERCAICNRPLQEYDEVTGTGILGYYHWTCVTHFD